MKTKEVFKPTGFKLVKINNEVCSIEGIVFKDKTWKDIGKEIRKEENRKKLFVPVKVKGFLKVKKEDRKVRFVFGELELIFFNNKVFAWEFAPAKHKLSFKTN